MSDWCTIESDPGVFSSLIESFGVANAQLTELYSLDDDSLRSLTASHGKVHGLVFLFKWQGHSSNQSEEILDGSASSIGTGMAVSEEDIPEDLFFARQMITNACATQALLAILLNAQSVDAIDGDGTDSSSTLVLGETLSSLKSFTTSFPPDLKGEAIGASDEIRNVHNSFARRETFLMDDSKQRVATKDDDVFHFIAYVPHSNGTVYELDGLQPGPISVGTYTPISTSSSSDTVTDTDHPWLTVARTAIQTRIQKYSTSEIKFNLMALTQDKRTFLQSKIKSLKEDDETMGILNLQLMEEEELRKQWKDENERRRHNYLPFCMELIKALAKSGNLQGFTTKAKGNAAASRLRRMG